MEKQTYFITEFTEFPGPRYCDQGDFSGENFYHTKLNKCFYNALINGKILSIVLDGTAGYASSFLDEAFGNLVFDFTLECVKKNLEIISIEEEDWKIMIENEVYLDWEKRRKSNKPAKKTIKHNSWHRFVNNAFVKNE
jgi:STAS-like domain of unknown function (DUF4325)